MMQRFMSCPFCGESDFDAIGLKAHLTYRGCVVFDDVPTLQEDRDERAGRAALGEGKEGS